MTALENLLAILETLPGARGARRPPEASSTASISPPRPCGGRHALGRRATPPRDRPRPDPVAPLHAPRRAVRRHRPDHRARRSARDPGSRDHRDRILITDHNVRDTLAIVDRATSSSPAPFSGRDLPPSSSSTPRYAASISAKAPARLELQGAALESTWPPADRSSGKH